MRNLTYNKYPSGKTGRLLRDDTKKLLYSVTLTVDYLLRPRSEKKYKSLKFLKNFI